MNPYKEINIDDINLLLKKNDEDRLQAISIMESRNSKSYLQQIFESNFYDILNDVYIDGIIMTYPSYGTVIRQSQRSFYYRGENQMFKTSTPSLYRKLNSIKNCELKKVERFISDLRIVDFLELILKFEHTTVFRKKRIDLLYEQLAQHYGFDTRWLDLTSDFEVALFFACCKLESNKWKPLKINDFNKNKKSGYGVIFRRKSNILLDLPLTQSNCIKIFPVGFQPFMRCHMQSSYVAQKDSPFNIQEDKSFEMFKFKHSEKLSKFIFERLNFGKDIYPNEGLNLLYDDIKKIKVKKIFSQDTFDFVYNDKKKNRSNISESLLSKYGYEIKDIPINQISDEKINQVNSSYANFSIEKNYKIRLRTRLTY